MSIEIKRAIYGTNEKNIDVTNIIKSHRKFEINNALFGEDPHPWTRKCLILEYVRDGKIFSSTLEENSIFDINLLPSKNFLCLCEGGNVRSVSLAWILKDHFHQNALAASWRWNLPETLDALYTWADYIIVMQGIFIEKIPLFYHSKVRVADVGPDRFGNPFHQDLVQILMPLVEKWSQNEFEIN